MAWMTDEAFELMMENREKKSIGISARNKKASGGGRVSVKMPSDYLTESQRNKLNGELKVYRCGTPIPWDEFSSYPIDIRKIYISNLRKKFHAPDEAIRKLFSVDDDTFKKCLDELQFKESCRREWEEDKWYAWVSGVPWKNL